MWFPPSSDVYLLVTDFSPSFCILLSIWNHWKKLIKLRGCRHLQLHFRRLFTSVEFSPHSCRKLRYGVFTWECGSLATHFQYCTVHMCFSEYNHDSLHDDISEIRGACREVHNSSNGNQMNGKHRVTRAVGTGPAATRPMFSQPTHAKIRIKVVQFLLQDYTRRALRK